jgi:glycosyltransferase involved in cell wall biosynthesis
VPPGVAVPAAPPGSVEGPPTVLYLGRVAHSKGLEVLPGAMSAVWDRVPDARLVVAGAGTPDTPKIRSMFDTVGGPGERSVEFRLDVSEEDKQSLLRSAAVLVLPSVRESFGIVILEAWAAATPVIVADSPVMNDTVDDGVDGVVVPAGDDHALATVLVERLEDPSGSRAMGLAGFGKVRDDYSWESTTERLEQVYDQVAAPSSQNPS